MIFSGDEDQGRLSTILVAQIRLAMLSVNALLSIQLIFAYTSPPLLPSLFSSYSPSSSLVLSVLSVLPILLPSCSLYKPKPALSRGPEFRDPPPFPVLCYVRGFASSLDVSGSTDMHASDRAMPTSDRHNVLRDTDVGAWVKHLLDCDGRGRLVLGCIGSEVDCPFVPLFAVLESANGKESVDACVAF